MTGGTGIVAPQKGLIEDCDVTNVQNGVYPSGQGVVRRCHIHDIGMNGVLASDLAVVEDSDIELTGAAGVWAQGTFVTVRNNRFARNGIGNNSDVVVVSSGVALVVDNVLDCETSARATGSAQIVTTGPGGSHPNIPLFVAGFC